MSSIQLRLSQGRGREFESRHPRHSSIDTAEVDIGWRWSAAAYSSFSGDNTVLGVKPMNTDHDNPPANRDNAGTPENFKPSLIPGARGKGGQNYTGSYSGSAEIE
jgi:hypothetical protein